MENLQDICTELENQINIRFAKAGKGDWGGNLTKIDGDVFHSALVRERNGKRYIIFTSGRYEKYASFYDGTTYAPGAEYKATKLKAGWKADNLEEIVNIYNKVNI